jgi:hypothetical protein
VMFPNTNLPADKRTQRIRESAREIRTDNDPDLFERAFERVVRSQPRNRRHQRAASLHTGTLP